MGNAPIWDSPWPTWNPENARKRDMILCGNTIVVAKHRSTGTCSSHFSGDADFSSSNKCVSLAVSPCIGPWPTGRVSCRPCELCCCDARCRYGGTAASDDEWDWWLGPRATADWMGDEKTGATKLPGWSEKGLLLTGKKQHGIQTIVWKRVSRIPLELAWLWGAKIIGVCASVFSSCYWGAFDGSNWVIELGRLPNLEDADGTGLLMLQMNYNRRNMMHTHNMCFFLVLYVLRMGSKMLNVFQYGLHQCAASCKTLRVLRTYAKM